MSTDLGLYLTGRTATEVEISEKLGGALNSIAFPRKKVVYMKSKVNNARVRENPANPNAIACKNRFACTAGRYL